MLARGIPLLLLFSVVLFVNTEMWQVFAGMNGATVAATAALLVVVGSAFLGVRLPREVERVERDVAAGPPLQRRQRISVGLVLFVTQALQIVLVARAVGAFFMAFGALVIPADVIESWTGTRRRQILSLNLGDIDVRVTVELLRVSAGIAALSGLYYSVWSSSGAGVSSRRAETLACACMQQRGAPATTTAASRPLRQYVTRSRGCSGMTAGPSSARHGRSERRPRWSIGIALPVPHPSLGLSG